MHFQNRKSEKANWCSFRAGLPVVSAFNTTPQLQQDSKIYKGILISQDNMNDKQMINLIILGTGACLASLAALVVFNQIKPEMCRNNRPTAYTNSQYIIGSTNGHPLFSSPAYQRFSEMREANSNQLNYVKRAKK